MSDPSPFDDFDVPAEEVQGGKVADSDDVFRNAPAPDADELDFDGGAPADSGFDHMNGAGAGGDNNNAGEDPFAEHHAAEAQDQPVDFGQSDQYAAAPPQEQEDIFQPSALSLWEQERKNVLADRISKAKESKQQAIAQGKADLDAFYKQRDEIIKKTQAQNRADEKDTRADLDNLMKNGTLWEKVGKMANLQPKGADGKTARMRKLLIQLKTDKVDADGTSKAKKK